MVQGKGGIFLILQPALGGNAKTSTICIVAPEEVHIEETKGTLQFASRATYYQVHIEETKGTLQFASRATYYQLCSNDIVIGTSSEVFCAKGLLEKQNHSQKQSFREVQAICLFDIQRKT